MKKKVVFMIIIANRKKMKSMIWLLKGKEKEIIIISDELGSVPDFIEETDDDDGWRKEKLEIDDRKVFEDGFIELETIPGNKFSNF